MEKRKEEKRFGFCVWLVCGGCCLKMWKEVKMVGVYDFDLGSMCDWILRLG